MKQPLLVITRGPALRIGLVGAGRRGAALLKLLVDWPEAKLAVVIDPRPETAAMHRARALDVPTAAHHLEVFKYDVDLVLEVTGQPAVLEELLRAKPVGVEVVGAAGLRFFWELLEDKVKTARRLEAQLDIVKAVGSTLNLKRQLAIATQKLAQVSGADRCGLYLWNEATGLVTPMMSQFATGERNERMWAALKGLGRLKLQEVPFLHEMMEQRGPIEIVDPASDPLVPPGWADLFQIKSMLVVPIFRENRVVGACTLNYCGEPRRFTSDQATLAIALAGQVALALENARLFEETQQRAFEVSTLHEIGTKLVSTLHLSVLLEEIAGSAIQLLGAQRCAAFELEPSDQRLHVRAYRGMRPDQPFMPIKLGQGAAGSAALERQPVFSPDVYAHPLPMYDEAWEEAGTTLRDVVLRRGYRAILAVPMVSKATVLGAICIYWDEIHPYDEREVQLLTALAQQAAVAIQNARLFEETKRRARTAEELAQTARMLTQSLDVSEVAVHTVERVLTVFQNKAAVVWLLQPDGSMEVIASGGQAILQPGTVFPRGKGIPGKVALEGKPLQTTDLLSDPTIILPDEVQRSVERWGTAAVLAVPLRARGKTIGTLTIRDHTGRTFSAEEVAVLETFAGQAALGLDNAQLYQEARRRTEKLETLARLTRLMTQATEPQQVLDFITRSAVGLLNAANAYLLLKEPAEPHDLVVQSSFGPKADQPSPRVPMGQGIIGRIAASRQPEFIADISEERGWLDPEFVKPLGRSFFGMPLVLGEDVVGCLAVFTDQPRPFDPEELGVLKIFADQAVIILENARLFDEVRRSYGDLRQAQEQLVRVERLRALGEMAAGVAHDFNNLLTVILGRAELLLERARDPESIPGLEAVCQAARDGAQTVRRIQEFTRTRLTRPLGRVDLAALLREVVDLTRPRWKDEAQSRGVSYTVEVRGGPGPVVAAISEELREVFINLLTNALEALPAGGYVRLCVEAGAEAAIVSVEDNGCGMSEEICRRVFEPFFTTKGPRGTGLGLAVAWGIITRHGGSIEVASNPGVGTMFTVRFPIGPELLAEALPEPVCLPTRSARLLVIDDEPQVRRVLRDLLTRRGYQVLEAADGPAALALLEATPVDLVVSDLSMPGMSGWEVAAACQARFPHLPVGLITGWGDQLDPDQIRRHRIRFVVAKPFTGAELLQQVTQALSPTASTPDQPLSSPGTAPSQV